MSHPPTNSGRVSLVGAGPGDPGLITQRGALCLAQADLVLYDYLVNPQLLELAPAAAERHCLGRHGQGRIVTLTESLERAVAAARQGKHVVRLKGGDPVVFAHLAEETAYLEQHGVPYEIVPGITAALAVGPYAGIPLTHREMASAVALVTGHEDAEKPQTAIDWEALARFPGTLVVYMGVTTVGHWTRALLSAGKPPETPAALVRYCSWPQQQRFDATLETLEDTLRQRRLRPPLVVVIGPTVSSSFRTDWFTGRPLLGKRVLVLRPAGQNQRLAQPLAELGADVRLQPAIEIAPPDDTRPLDALIDRLGEYDWLVFSSISGVQFFAERLWSRGYDARRLAGARLACVGPGTADELARYHLRADLVPTEHRAEGLAAELAAHVAGRRVALVRASRGRPILAQQLQAAGALVESVVAYESRDVTRADPRAAADLAGGRIDWVVVSSSAIARSAVSLFGESLRRARLLSISPITSDVLRELGFEPSAEASPHSLEGLVATLVRQASDET